MTCLAPQTDSEFRHFGQRRIAPLFRLRSRCIRHGPGATWLAPQHDELAGAPPLHHPFQLRLAAFDECSLMARLTLTAHEKHVEVSASPCVVGEVVTWVVGVVINDDFIAAPIPVTGISEVVGRDAEIEAIEPEPAGRTSHESPDMSGAEAASEVAVLPRTIDVVVFSPTSDVMTDPSIATIYVRSFGMAGLIVEVTVFRTDRGVLRRCVAYSRGSARRRLRMILWASMLGTLLIPMPLIASTILCETYGAQS